AMAGTATVQGQGTR
nr:RecName: Full=Peroxidase [Pseudotsuga menziesii]